MYLIETRRVYSDVSVGPWTNPLPDKMFDNFASALTYLKIWFDLAEFEDCKFEHCNLKPLKLFESSDRRSQFRIINSNAVRIEFLEKDTKLWRQIPYWDFENLDEAQNYLTRLYERINFALRVKRLGEDSVFYNFYECPETGELFRFVGSKGIISIENPWEIGLRTALEGINNG